MLEPTPGVCAKRRHTRIDLGVDAAAIAMWALYQPSPSKSQNF